MKVHDFGLAIIFILLAGVCFLGTTNYNMGIEDSFRVKGFEVPAMYGSFPGITDKEAGFWKDVRVQEQAYKMASAVFGGNNVIMVGKQAYLFRDGKWWTLATNATATHLMIVEELK